MTQTPVAPGPVLGPVPASALVWPQPWFVIDVRTGRYVATVLAGRKGPDLSTWGTPAQPDHDAVLARRVPPADPAGPREVYATLVAPPQEDQAIGKWWWPAPPAAAAPKRVRVTAVQPQAGQPQPPGTIAGHVPGNRKLTRRPRMKRPPTR